MDKQGVLVSKVGFDAFGCGVFSLSTTFRDSKLQSVEVVISDYRAF